METNVTPASVQTGAAGVQQVVDRALRSSIDSEVGNLITFRIKGRGVAILGYDAGDKLDQPKYIAGQ